MLRACSVCFWQQHRFGLVSMNPFQRHKVHQRNATVDHANHTHHYAPPTLPSPLHCAIVQQQAANHIMDVVCYKTAISTEVCVCVVNTSGRQAGSSLRTPNQSVRVQSLAPDKRRNNTTAAESTNRT